MKIEILRPTIAKHEPIDSSKITSPILKFAADSGETFLINWFIPAANHWKVELSESIKGRYNWYFYKPDVLVRGTSDYSVKPTLTATGIEIIKRHEGLSLSAYPDPGTGGEPWTICYGSTGSDVYPGLELTLEECQQRLTKDLMRFEEGVISLVKVPLNQNQFTALVSFAYNAGLGSLQSSTLLKLLNQGDYAGCADQFLRWVNGGNGPLPGLMVRREAERSLFLS